MPISNCEKGYLICVSLLLLTAGCVSEAEPAASGSSLTGVWVHDSSNPVFLFEFSPSGSVNVVFMSFEDPGRPGYADVVTGRWEESGEMLAITYTAPLSGNVVTLHLEKSGSFLVLTGATTADDLTLKIADLEGIRFIRGESYSDTMMGDYQVDIF